MPILPYVDVEEIEDSVHPVYMRDSITYHMYVRELKRRAADAMMAGKAMEEKPRVPKWKVRELNLNSWRDNTIDHRTIYSLAPRETALMDPRTVAVRCQPPTPPDADLPSEQREEKVERGYIREISRSMPSAGKSSLHRLLSNTMQSYNKPVTIPTSDDSYGKPRHEFDLRNVAPRKPNFETITKMPSGANSYVSVRTNSDFCQRQNRGEGQFCEVLGPSACMKCIESVNRQMATELQSSSFPGLDCSTTSLVGPRLASIITKNEMKQSRQNKKRERHNNKMSRSRSRGCSRQKEKGHSVMAKPSPMFKLPMMRVTDAKGGCNDYNVC